VRNLHEIALQDVLREYGFLRRSRYFPKELEHYNPVGLTKEKIVELFAYVVEHVPEELQDRLPKHVQQLYNFIFIDEVESRSGYMSEFKHVRRCDQFGRVEGFQAFLINEMLVKGGYALPEIARAAGCNVQRIHSHLNALRKEFAETHIIVTQKRGRLSRYYLKEKKKDEPKADRRVVVKSLVW